MEFLNNKILLIREQLLFLLKKGWGKKVFFSFVDQAFFSGTNFIISILLGRWLIPSAYGAYAVSSSVFLFILGIQSSLILEPFSVYGSSHHHKDFDRYLSNLLIVLLFLACGLGLILFVSTFFFITDKQQASYLLAMALASPFIVLIWFTRQACYIHTQTEIALVTSSSYSFSLLLVIFVLNKFNLLQPISIYSSMALCCLLSVILPLRKLQFRFKSISIVNICKKDVIKENWEFGKWILIASISNWIATSSYLPLLSLFSGSSSAAGLRALQNLILPLQQVLSVVYLILIPRLSKINFELGVESIKNATKRMLQLLTPVIIIYCLVITLFSRQLLYLLFNNKLYVEYAWLIPGICLSTIMLEISHIIGVSVRSIEGAREIFWSKFWSCISVLIIGIFLIWRWSLLGAIISIFISATIEVITIILGYSKRIRFSIKEEFTYEK